MKTFSYRNSRLVASDLSSLASVYDTSITDYPFGRIRVGGFKSCYFIDVCGIMMKSCFGVEKPMDGLRPLNFVLKTALFSCSVFAPIFASFGLPRGPQNGPEIEEFRVRFSRALRSRSRDPLRDDFAWFSRSFRTTFPNVFPTFAEKCKVHENTLYACFREGRELRKPSESRPETMPENRFARGNLFGCSEVRFGVVLASRATPK